ncbi:MAG: response regulator [Sulfuricellaceae bacterium]|nr:response regulator [Sulfuricellaceae bacterium]
MMYRIMLVDDEENILKALRRVLANTPCIYDGVEYPVKVEMFTSADEALDYAHFNAVDLVLSDYRMPGKDGVAFLREFKEIQPHAARLILSGYADLNAVIGAINEAQIYRFLNKPWNDYELVSSIAQALAYRNLTLENLHLADQARLEQGAISPQELERKRLEEQEPGITKVNWGPDGSVILDISE